MRLTELFNFTAYPFILFFCTLHYVKLIFAKRLTATSRNGNIMITQLFELVKAEILQKGGITYDPYDKL